MQRPPRPASARHLGLVITLETCLEYNVITYRDTGSCVRYNHILSLLLMMMPFDLTFPCSKAKQQQNCDDKTGQFDICTTFFYVVDLWTNVAPPEPVISTGMLQSCASWSNEYFKYSVPGGDVNLWHEARSHSSLQAQKSRAKKLICENIRDF